MLVELLICKYNVIRGHTEHDETIKMTCQFKINEMYKVK